MASFQMTLNDPFTTVHLSNYNKRST